jgi:zinc protease
MMRLMSVSRLFRGLFIIAFCAKAFSGSLFAQVPDRSKPPEISSPSSLALPPIQHFTLSNGLSIVLMEKHELPLVQMELIVSAGSVSDPEGRRGLASVTASLMDEGAGGRTALQFADAVDYLGAKISSYAGQHTSGVSLHTPLSKLDSAMALFADVVLRPRFPAEELERQRTDRLTTLTEWHDDPGTVATILFNKSLYGIQHPYGLPTIGNEVSIRSFTVDDVRAFHETYFHPNNATLVVVGDVTKDVILPKLEAAFGGWKPANISHPSLSAIHQIKDREILLIDKLEAAQSVVRIGCVGVERSSSDYDALLVMNTILGGSFASRLNQNLREEHQYSYGAGSGFDFRVLRGPFVAYADVQTAVTDKSIAEMMEELRKILEPVADDELKRAKNYLTLRYAENFQSVSQVASELGDLVVYHLPDDYFNRYTEHILAITKDDVQRVAKKYLDTEKISIVVVGDRKQIEQGIVNLHLGTVHTLTIDDVLGPSPRIENK